MTRVPFNDLARIHAPLRARILARFGEILDRSAFVLGPEVAEFEAAFTRFLGGKGTGLAVSNGLDALTVALRALGVGAGDEVVLPSNTFIATAFAVLHAGATPVFCDIAEGSPNLDPRSLERVLTSRTRAVIPVHLYGVPAPMRAIREIARSKKLFVVEDAAQAHGARTSSKEVCGTLGDAGCFSFYPGKNLGSLGEGGFVWFRDEAVAKRARAIRDVGQEEKGVHAYVGGNYRMHTLQAAALLEKLPHLEAWNEERTAIGARFEKEFSSLPGVHLLSRAHGGEHAVYHLFVLELPNQEVRDEFRLKLRERGIDTGIHYSGIVPLQECFEGKSEGEWKRAEERSGKIVSLPIFPGMTGIEQDAVIQAVKDFFDGR